MTLNEGVCLAVEVDPQRARRRVETAYCDEVTESVDEALRLVAEAKGAGKPSSVALVGNAAEVLPQLLQSGFQADVVTDQTSAHDPLNGYVPAGLPLDAAGPVAGQPRGVRAALDCQHGDCVEAMSGFMRAGLVVFDYGNNIRHYAEEAWVKDAFAFPGFVPAFIRPLFCEGKGPFRWATLSGDPKDIAVTDEVILREFPDNEPLCRWIRMAGRRCASRGCRHESAGWATGSGTASA